MLEFLSCFFLGKMTRTLRASCYYLGLALCAVIPLAKVVQHWL